MYKQRVIVGGTEADVRAWGPDETPSGVPSWSLKSIQTQWDIPYGQKPLADGICGVLKSMGVHKAYAPHVSPASAKIVETNVLKQIDLGEERMLYRNCHAPADGVFLGKGRAFVMSGSGCPVIIAAGGDKVVVAHAGRDSLIDRGVVMEVPITREHVSVVNAVVSAFRENDIAPHQISMRMLFSIPAAVFEHRFDHPQHGQYNLALFRFLNERWPMSIIRRNGAMYLDLETLFEEQARSAGIMYALAMCPLTLAEFPGLTHTRRDGRDPSERNLVVVKRCS